MDIDKKNPTIHFYLKVWPSRCSSVAVVRWWRSRGIATSSLSQSGKHETAIHLWSRNNFTSEFLMTLKRLFDEGIWFLAISGASPCCWCWSVTCQGDLPRQAFTSHAAQNDTFFCFASPFVTSNTPPPLLFTPTPTTSPWAIGAEMEGEMDDVVLNCDMSPCKSFHYYS